MGEEEEEGAKVEAATAGAEPEGEDVAEGKEDGADEEEAVAEEKNAVETSAADGQEG